MKMTRTLTVWSFLILHTGTPVQFFSCCGIAHFRPFVRTFCFYLSEIFIAGEVLNRNGGSPILFQHLFWFLPPRSVHRIDACPGYHLRVIATNACPILVRARSARCLEFLFCRSSYGSPHACTGMNPFLGNVFMILTLITQRASGKRSTIGNAGKGNWIYPAMVAIGLVSYLFLVINGLIW